MKIDCSKRSLFSHIIGMVPAAMLIPATIAAAEPLSSGLISQVPLREGLTIVAVGNFGSGDYELIQTVTSVDAKAITVNLRSEELSFCAGKMFGGPGKPRTSSQRAVLREDLEHAHALRREFTTCVLEPEFNAGMTALGVSADVLRELKAKGQTNFSVMRTLVKELASGVLTRIERESVPFKIILNDKPVEVAVIHAR